MIERTKTQHLPWQVIDYEETSLGFSIAWYDDIYVDFCAIPNTPRCHLRIVTIRATHVVLRGSALICVDRKKLSLDAEECMSLEIR